jgi:glucosamine--fructose-6-phosphate aminotransferase (isomerizing)
MTTSDEPATFMDTEIGEQPQVWRRLLASDQFGAAAEQIRRRRPRFVLLAARGTSDHAALYAKYLVEVSHQLPAGLVSPSTMTAYGAKPDLRDVLIFGVSQSGGSPDLIKSLEVARAQGALTVSVTNNAESELAHVAEVHVDILAGRERAVAATKSYTAQLLALYLLLDYVRGGSGAAATALPDLGDDLLGRSPQIAALAQRYRFAQRLVTTARGYSYPTVREAALKLMETSYLSAQAFSGADLMHGPLAVVDAQVPVLTVIANGPGGKAMHEVLLRLVGSGADVFTVGTAQAVAESTNGVVLPPNVPEEVSPILEILPFQQLAMHVAVGRGENPDAPRGLRKVTETL